MKLVCTAIVVVFIMRNCLADEISCSKYDYEERVLHKLIRLEFEHERMKTGVFESLKKSESQYSEVKSSMNEFDVKIAETVKTVDRNVSEVLAGFEERFSTLEQKMLNTLDSQQKKLDEFITGRKPVASIAFMSRKAHKSKPDRGETIIFKTTLMNQGGGYDNTTGVFTAPVDGVYLFTTQFCIGTGGRYMFSRIMHDDTPIQRSQIYDKDSDYCSSSNAVVVIKTSERVWVECVSTSSTSSVMYENSDNWNTFSGTRIHEENIKRNLNRTAKDFPHTL